MYSFIVNPNSRSGEGREIWNHLRSIMESRGISYQYFLTEYVAVSYTHLRAHETG